MQTMEDTAACPVGGVMFVSYPSGAEVFMDGMDQGIVTPAVITEIPAGVHAYTLKLAGYNDSTGSVEVKENQIAGVTVNLVPASSKGLLAGLALMGLTMFGTLTI